MKLSLFSLTLQLHNTFRVAHGASEERRNVLLRLQTGNLTGYGEAAAVFYYGDAQESLTAALQTVDSLPNDIFALEEILNGLPPLPPAARAAVDMALHDLWGKRLKQPLYRLLGLSPSPLPLTSFTIGLDTPERMAALAREQKYPLIKIKLDAFHPEAQVAAIRQATDARLRVDANAAWSAAQALEIIPRLEKYNLELVEQPLPSGDPQAYAWLRQNLRAKGVSLPIFADESVRNARDVAAHAGAVDGVVIKLMKTGGLREALRAIHTARACGMQIMLSCMIESSLGVTAAAHLAPLCDFLDLDGPLLIANDPFDGLRYAGAALSLPDRPGLGARPVTSGEG